MYRKPWKCPICNGAGVLLSLDDGRFTAQPMPTMCHGCHGVGIVWEPVELKPVKIDHWDDVPPEDRD
jgi:hypothetical protein